MDGNTASILFFTVCIGIPCATHMIISVTRIVVSHLEWKRDQ